MACVSVADRVQPGELMRLVEDGLIAAGVGVRLLATRHGRRLIITCPGAERCALAVSDCGLAEWECCPRSGGRADPKQVADLATALLTGRAGDYPCQGAGYGRPGATLKGIAGLELQARGMDVELEIYEDKTYLEARSLIVVTNPAAADPATVQVTDDGCITWSCDYWDDPCAQEVPGPAEVAAAVVATVTTALSQGLPSLPRAGQS